jgi:hypothetical protein
VDKRRMMVPATPCTLAYALAIMSELTNLLPDGTEREDVDDMRPGNSVRPTSSDDKCDYLKGQGKRHVPELSKV